MGTITEGKVNLGEGITFATIQTMCKLDLAQYRDYWDCIITDEVHRVSGSPTAVTQYQKVLNSLSARHKYGLSATVHRSDGMIKATYALVGEVAYKVPDEAVADKIMKVGIYPVGTGVQISREALNTDGTLNYTNKTWGDFFPESKHLGGMWDYLMKGEDGKTIEAVLEMKTTKRAEDWQNDVPEYYALQAALYAYLYGVDDVIMVASFLDEKDYKDPAAYQPTASNTITVEFKVSERYPDFADKVAAVEQWWADYVDTGISPEYDEKKDAEILAALRTNTLSPETDIEALIAEAEGLKKELDEISASTADKEKRLKTINDIIKEHAMGQFRDGDKKVEVKGSTYVWTVSRSETTSVDKDALKADGLLDKYSKKSETYRMTVK